MQEQVTDKLLRVAQECDDITQANHDVLVADENTDITLPDGTTTPSLSKRVKQFGGQVTKVVGKAGDISADDIADALELGTAAKYAVEDLPKTDKADQIKTASDQNQQEINDFGGAKWYAKVGGYKLGATVKLENGDTVKSTVPNNTANPNVDMTGWVLVNSDSKIKTWSGRTQESKNKDTVSALDFGIIPNSLEDQTAKFDDFVNYLRINKVKGLLPSGTIKITANKSITFGVVGETAYRVVPYAVDISGVDIEGVYKGYENQDGTILDIQGTGCGLMQASSSVKNTTYTVKSIRVQNATIALNMTYALFCRIENFVYKDVENAIIIGEPTYNAGAMCNIFTNIVGKCSRAPLQILGKQWNNANQFHNCFFTGGEPSYIHVQGGYGAIANAFYGGELNSPSSLKCNGIVLGNCRSTSFYNTYFESRGHAIVLDGQAKKVLLSNCTYGTTRNDATNSTQPCIIWHKSAAASVTVSGGCVFLGDSTGLQDNMRFIYSDSPSNFICSIESAPYAYLTGVTGWKLLDIVNVSNFASFEGIFTDSTSVEFSTAGAIIDNLDSTSKVTYHLNGKMLTVTVDLAFKADTVFNLGDYYIRSLFTPKDNCLGVSHYTKAGDTTLLGTANISINNRNIFLWMPNVSSTFDDVTKTVSTKLSSQYMSGARLSGYNVVGSRVRVQLVYPI